MSRALRQCLRGFLLTLAIGGAQCLAVEPIDISDPGTPAFTVYGSRDGLGDEVWNTIGFDARGFVWAGSASGVARFDGYRWQPFAIDAGGGRVHGFGLDDRGTFWALLQGQGLVRWDGQTFTPIGKNHAMMQHVDFATTDDGRSILTVGSEDGVLELRDGAWQLVPDDIEGASWERVRTKALFGKPRDWIASSIGLWYRDVGDTGPWQRFQQASLGYAGISDLVLINEAGRESLWVISYGSGLTRITADGLRTWRSVRGELPSEAMYQGVVTRGAEGLPTLWISSRGGLIRIRNEVIDWFDRRHGLPSDAVRNVEVQRGVDGIDQLWVATESGIARTALTGSHWQTVSLLGATYNGTFGAMLEPDGRGGERLWVGGAKDGIGMLEAGRWRYFTYADGTLPFEGTRRIWRLPDGQRMQRLVAPIYGGLFRIDDAYAFHRYPVPWDAEPGESAHAALAVEGASTADPTWWFGVRRGGTWRRLGGQWASFTLLPERPFWSVNALTEQPPTETQPPVMWAASNVGVARFDGTHWTLLPSPTNVAEESFRHVTMVREGPRRVLWASSSSAGVIRYDVTDPKNPVMLPKGELPRSPDPTVYSVMQDSRDRIYVCTNNGVQRLVREEDGGFSEQVFHRRDGLVHDECNSGAQFIDDSDRYWVGTLGGLSMYDPAFRVESGATGPKSLWLTDIRLDGRSVPIAGEVTVPAGVRELDVAFTLLVGRRESETRYRTQLVGDEPAPSAWNGEPNRQWSRLPPGRYTFKVEARDYAGQTVQAELLDVMVSPHWWQRRSLQGLVAFAIVMFGLFLLRSYNLRQRARRDELAREVAQRTSALDAANQQLRDLSYRDPLTAIANRRRFLEALDVAIVQAMESNTPVGLILADVDHFKQFNDQYGHQLGDEALKAVAGALAQCTRDSDLTARYGGEEFACLVVRADTAQVAILAERMRSRVAGLTQWRSDITQPLTISLGGISLIPTRADQADELLRFADAALYEAKHAGRNCVRMSGAR